MRFVIINSNSTKVISRFKLKAADHIAPAIGENAANPIEINVKIWYNITDYMLIWRSRNEAFVFKYSTSYAFRRSAVYY